MFRQSFEKANSGSGNSPEPPGGTPFIKNSTDLDFVKDVLEPSQNRIVLVDFWAPWCGPCRQLTPLLEKAVQNTGGKVALVKINIDENPNVAGQLGVQSIPAVFAFKDGRPVDGFMGALPESQIKTFLAKLTGAPDEAGDETIVPQFERADQALSSGDTAGAAQIYAEILAGDPENPKAIAGLARCYLANGDSQRAKTILDLASPDLHKNPEIIAAQAALELSLKAQNNSHQGDGNPGDVKVLEAKLTDHPDDHALRLTLAEIFAGRGQYDAAIDHFFYILSRDQNWNEGAARLGLLTVFEAAGPGSETTKKGRRRLSQILFS